MKEKVGSPSHVLFFLSVTVGLLCAATSLSVAQENWEPGDEWRGAYKEGDRVQLKITDGMWQTGTVIGNNPVSAMRLDCEEYVEPAPGTYRRAGGIYTNTSKTDIRPFRAVDTAEVETVKTTQPDGDEGQQPKEVDATKPDEGPAAKTDRKTAGCDFEEPVGTVSKDSEPSERLFKRLIYETYRDKANGRKVSISYQSFQLGESYINRLRKNVNSHDGAPESAVIHTVRTKFILCESYTDSTIRWVYDAQYSCFKDRFGEWVCPSDSTRILEQTYLNHE